MIRGDDLLKNKRNAACNLMMASLDKMFVVVMGFFVVLIIDIINIIIKIMIIIRGFIRGGCSTEKLNSYSNDSHQ